MKLKNLVKKTMMFFFDRIPIKNIIIFESAPDYSDNTRMVFDEFINRRLNNKYTLVWVCNDEKNVDILNNKFKDLKNVKCVHYNSRKFYYYYQKIAKAFVVCNNLYSREKEQQYYCDLAHGCALKNAVGYSLPASGDNVDVMTISNYLAPFDAHNLSCDVSYMNPLGYARNDDLFEQIDLHKAFDGRSFSKVIYWLPTYRQNHWGTSFHSDISMPILYTEGEAKKLNECAKNSNVLVVVKVHPAQDLTKVNEFNLSNVLFIKNDFFYDKDFTNYQVLGSVDAMISDYSSVYYDYLLCDKPIGLCFDDFEEYNKREGFTMDPNVILKGGKKLYNIDDLCAFVESVASGEDKLANERNEIKNLVHDHIDNKSTERIVEYIMNKI